MSIENADYRQLREDAYRLVYRQIRDHAAAEDVVQDSFLRLSRYQGTIGNLGAMVRVIATNLMRDRARILGRRAEDPLPETYELAAGLPSAEESLLHREQVGMVERILQDMPPLRREVFLRRRLRGESAREVAQALEITPAAVDTHVARAVLALHKAMAEISRRENAA